MKRKTRKHFNPEMALPFTHDQSLLPVIIKAKLLVLYREQKLTAQIYFEHDGVRYQTADRHTENEWWCQEIGLSPRKIQYLFKKKEIQNGALDTEEHERIALGSAKN